MRSMWRISAPAYCIPPARPTASSPVSYTHLSTGVIGQPLPIEPIEQAASALAGALSREGGADAEMCIRDRDNRVERQGKQIGIESWKKLVFQNLK